MAYRVINGFNYPDDANRSEENPKAEIRVEAGTILADLPSDYADAIIEMGCVEEIEEDDAPTPKRRK